jgi:hypothetical protein
MIPTRLISRLSSVALLSVVVVACSSSSASSTPTPTPSPTATPTAPASSASALPSFNLPSNAKELEALLPDTLGSTKLTKFSMKGSDFVSQSDNPELKAWLDSLGKSLNDVSAAYAFDITGTTETGIFAFRVNGVDHNTLLQGLKTAMDKGDSAPTSWTNTNVGGKDVLAATTDSGTTYLYGTADLVFFVVAKDQATAGEALSKLP